ncbi:MAG TPA: ADOP family duplicated permease [Gemmatimonadaceae bacterium]|nr:ADOP family duplicated permease [Gemmatimonadaceae bacterium]
MADLSFRLRALFARRGLERQLDEEFAFHLEMEAAKLRAQGLSPADAMREAQRRFGSATRAGEAARDRWGVSLAWQLAADVRHAWRQYRRRPGFTAIAVFTLGVGIGATVAIGSAAHSLLVAPLPVDDESRIDVFWFPQSWRGAEFDHVRTQAHGFDAVAAFGLEGVRLESPDATQLLLNVLGSAELFDVLGARPLLGRGFRAGEDRPGADPVVVISHGLWQQELGGDPAVIGRRLLLDGVPTTVIGVMPHEFFFPSRQFRAWRPLVLDPATRPYHGSGWLTLVGRSGPDRTATQRQHGVEAIARSLGERFTYTTEWDKSRNPNLTPLRQHITGNAGAPLVLLLSAAGSLLLMAIANAAALLLARTSDRRDEMALRTALGAGRGRLARQIVAESLTLALIAAVTGALAAAVTFRTLVAALPVAEELRDLPRLSWWSLGTACALALVVGLSVAVIPVRHLLRGRLDGLLGRARTHVARAGTRRAHAALVASEVALAMLLVVGATLMIRSVDRLRAIDPGFDPAGVFSVDVVTGTSTSDADRRRAFFSEVLERARALPGVTRAGLTNRLPIRDGGWQGPVRAADRPDLTGPSRPNAYYRVITPDFFRTIGAELAEGRDLSVSDGGGGLPVAVVNETFARRLWPGEGALGRRITTGMDGIERTVVGVVRDIRLVSMVGENPAAVYVPHEQSGVNPDGLVLTVRYSGPQAGLVDAVRGLVREVDPGAIVIRSGSLESAISGAIADRLRLRFFLSLFGVLALLLGAVGVYGVVAYSVSRRLAEFGIRMALGAAPARVRWEVLRDGLMPAGVGLALGLAGALALSRLLAGFLYGVTGTDVPSLLTAGVTLLAAGVTAALWPAWRAGRVSPRTALGAE